jgi:hypothetical protein
MRPRGLFAPVIQRDPGERTATPGAAGACKVLAK